MPGTERQIISQEMKRESELFFAIGEVLNMAIIIGAVS